MGSPERRRPEFRADIGGLGFGVEGLQAQKVLGTVMGYTFPNHHIQVLLTVWEVYRD